MFGHGLGSPTLADVLMLTGLNISTADDGSLFNQKPKHRVDTRNIGGWSGYIQKYHQTRSIGQREHAIFLNMWLDKFIFCGWSVGPTCVYLAATERLANGSRFPLGRYLVSYAYHLLHQVTEKFLLGEPIGNLGGPWWFINMWLNAHMHKHLQWDFFMQNFHKISLKITSWQKMNRNSFAPQLRRSHHSPSRDRCKWEPDWQIILDFL